ncbi:MAG: DUF72 domain-containing protein [Chromatiales bacterium]|nr:MAG: DUF72 domain-containing protein [Chromatiales bacterium]
MALTDQYRLGLPAWGFPGWRDRYFTAQPSQLAGYARVFNTVEGNTSFYGVPERTQISKWQAEVADVDFRFCFKLPREVTHERWLDADTLGAFLRTVEPLGDKLGPLLVQFPATVGPAQLPQIRELLSHLPVAFRFVLEVRHPAFFDQPEILHDLLNDHGAGRVIMDTRPLYLGDRSHPEVLAALHKKPDLPVLTDVNNHLAFVRLILHPDLSANDEYIAEWATRVAGWLGDGHEVFMMIHCPNNLYCPELADQFHRALRARPGMAELPPLAPWPVPQQAQLL